MILEGLVTAAKKRAQAERQAEQSKLTPEERQEKQARLRRFLAIEKLFHYPEFEDLRQWFLEQYSAEEQVLLEDVPMADADLQIVRYKMQLASKIYTLDSDVSERIKLLRTQLNSEAVQPE